MEVLSRRTRMPCDHFGAAAAPHTTLTSSNPYFLNLCQDPLKLEIFSVLAAPPNYSYRLVLIESQDFVGKVVVRTGGWTRKLKGMSGRRR